MGSPKALLPFSGETFLDRLIGIFSAVCSSTIVVLGYHAATIRAGLSRAEQAVFVENLEPERGQLSSLQCGLAAVPEDAAGVLFTPVDYPAVRVATVAQVAAESRGGAPAVIPRFGGRHGHPVYASRALVAELLTLPPEAQARDVIHRYADRTLYFDVDDPGVLRDVDDREDYRALLDATQIT